MGRGRDIYELKKVGSEGWNSASVGEVGNGRTLYPRLAQKPGKERLDSR